jgi:hypothetical protein
LKKIEMLFRNRDKSNQTNRTNRQIENDHANGKKYENGDRKDGKQYQTASYSQEYLLRVGVCDLLCAY